jgi:GT2 family glycosyltransferase/ubiquinone/menaquinone biosynthesis C-methylase UbiE
MEFTGERYVPSVEGQIKYEHLHRYALSLDLVAGKAVMDIASGEGYGSALLASTARSVTGVDVDPVSVEHAKHSYFDPKLNFVVGSCDSIPLPDASFDVVTSFETIEHHDKHERMLGEIKRLLKPEGILIISSPNRLTYSDEPGYTNPFHVKELYYDEFYELLRQHFKHLRIYGQRLATGSFVFPLTESRAANLKALTGNAAQVLQQVCDLPSPIYFVAVCSDSPEIKKREISSVYLDRTEDLFRVLEAERVGQIRRIQDQVQQTEAELVRLKTAHEDELNRQAQEMREARSEYEMQIRLQSEDIVEMKAKYEAQLSQQSDELRRTQDQAEQTREQLLIAAKIVQNYQESLSAAQSQLSRHADVLDWIFTSRSWRLSTKLRQFEQLGLHYFDIRRWRPGPSRETLQGVLDFPKSENKVSDSLEIYGWVYSTAAPVKLVQAFLDDVYLGSVSYGLERPDVVAAFPGEAPLECGYKERVWLSGLRIDGERVLKIRIYDEVGNRQSYTRTVTIEPSPVFSLPPADLSRSPIAGIPMELNAGANPVELLAAELSTRMAEAITEFQSRMERDPSILDWDSGLNLARSFPQLAVCSPPPVRNADNTLPHLDRSIDIVVTSSPDEERIAEARRVAAVAVIRTTDLQPYKLQQSMLPKADQQPPLSLEVEWQSDAVDEQLLPIASIIIPVYNEVRYTESCLEQLSKTLPRNFKGEIIVVDDASSDETPAVLQHCAELDKRIKVLRNPQNAGFIASCNRGAEAACGEILVFLNNDTLPLPGWLPPLLRVLRDKPDAGAVGGKLVYPDGKLQEAGGIIFSDGSGCNFGKFDRAANAPLYNFLREVDYCSAALLATRRALFMEVGGFDTRFEPAYYEDTDYCFSLRERGYRVYYQPESVIVHFEGASSGTDITAGVKSYQAVNRKKFIEKWSEALRHQPPAPERYNFAALHALSRRR